MNKLILVGIASTTLVIAFGVSLITPVFFTSKAELPPQRVMLSFSIVSEEGSSVQTKDDPSLSKWCQELASIFETSKIRATVFIAGKDAERNPECVRALASNEQIDIGSQTFSYVPLTSIDDYTIQLQEVRNGKTAVDNAGNISSLSFKAPNGKTDLNIYSLLNRSDIIADFSYDDHYNKYYKGYYIWFNITSHDGKNYQTTSLRNVEARNIPVVLNFDSRESSIEEIRTIFSQLNHPTIRDEIQFVNASDLAGFKLTIRSSEKG